jgi:hypothetical protein
MKYKRIIALLAAAAIAGSLAGCKAAKLPGQASEPAPEISVQVSDATQSKNDVIGTVASIDGSKITIEIGELVQRSSSRDGNNGDGKEPSGSRKRRSDDGNGKDCFPGRSRGYTFKGTSKSATYDLSGLKQITLENDSDDTPDTIDEIKTGDVVVITLGDDGNPAALTVKSLGGRPGNFDGKGSGKNRGDRDDSNRKSKKSRRSDKDNDGENADSGEKDGEDNEDAEG